MDNSTHHVMSTQKSMNQCSQQSLLISLRRKKFPLNLMQSFDVEAKGKQVQILISKMILFPNGKYTFAPHSLFQKLRLFSFSTL